jgi:pyruvate dehydrogenase E2 component (dihydrolipoamide acetyltransferase)
MTVAEGETLVEIPMPRLADSMADASIAAWLKRAGDEIAVGEPLLEVETDKTTVVYEAETAGRLVEILVPAGSTASVGEPIARMAPRVSLPDAGATAGRPRGSRRSATPVARRLADQLGVSLEDVRGTGPGGRIVRADVVRDAGGAAPAAPPAAAPSGGVRLELTPTQLTIARRMTMSRTEIPEFTVQAEIDVTAALALRREINALDPDARITVNDLFVKAAALALREFPNLNASFEDGAIVRHAPVNVGVAVAAAGALYVPVVENADRLSLPELAARSRQLAAAARIRTAPPGARGTFTVSNLGMHGVTAFTAVINPPQVAILAVGAARRLPRFDEHEAVTARDVAEVSLSCDHRAVYGDEAARFLGRLRDLLERPLLLVMPGSTNEGSR